MKSQLKRTHSSQIMVFFFFNCKVEEVEKIFICIIFQVRENGSDCFILIHIVITGVQLP